MSKFYLGFLIAIQALLFDKLTNCLYFLSTAGLANVGYLHPRLCYNTVLSSVIKDYAVTFNHRLINNR